MKLFYSTTSPFVRKVRMVMVYGELENIELILINPFDGNEQDTPLRTINPLGKIPALVTDTLTLTDSPLICEYLNDIAIKKGKTDLFCKQGNYYLTQLIHAQANGIIDAAVATLLEKRRDTAHSTHWLQRWQTAIYATLDGLKPEQLGSAKTPHIGTMATAAALGYLDFRFADLQWRTHQPELSQWHNQFMDIDWYTQTAPHN